MSRARFLLACLLAALALPVIRAEAEIRRRHVEPIALCPKVEYRIIQRRGVAVRDTLTLPCTAVEDIP